MPDVFNAPQQLVYPASALMALSRQEINQCIDNGPLLGDALKCEVPLNIGVFFDGTNNNAKRDEPERCHTNIVRLFNAHPDVGANKHLERPGHYRIYVPGAGTPFDANGELRESREGKAFGKGGQARILYAVVKTLNAVYRAGQGGQNLYEESDIADLLKAFAEQVEGGQNDPERPRPSRNQWLADLHESTAQKIEHARRLAPLPRIPDIFISVFGFSRGAAQAVAFCHWLHAALPRGQIAGMPVRIGFLGLFDCVASVGISDADHRALQTRRGVAPEAVQPLAQCRNREALVRQHMRLYYDFRRESLGELPGGRPEFWQYPQARPSDQDGDDIDSYNALLMGDLHLLDNRKPALPCNSLLEQRVMRLRYARYRSDVHPQQYASQASDQAWIAWALPVMRGDRRVGGSDHMWLLGRYVHDSLAGFCLLGAGSREEKAEKLLELVEKRDRREPLNAYEAKVMKNYDEKSKTNMALAKAIARRREKADEIENSTYGDYASRRIARENHLKASTFEPDEKRVIDESGVFPLVSDRDAPDLYESWSEKLALQTLTHGRREGGGYFLPRMVFE